jgi:hypothetical protein
MKPFLKAILLLCLISMILSCSLPGEKAAEAEETAPIEAQPLAPSETQVQPASDTPASNPAATAVPEDTATAKPKDTETTEPSAEEPPASGGSHFEYMVSGCREAIISGSVVEDNAIPILYTLILQDDGGNALLLYLPIELGDEYFEVVVPYDVETPTWPTASLYLAPDTFEAQEGMVYIYYEPDGSISGNMEFSGINAEDADCEVYVMLNFDHLPLPEM